MDLRCDQAGAAHFTYVLPFTDRRALVEDTYFAPPGVRPPDHRAAVGAYLRERYGGAEGYLRTRARVTQDDLARVRAGWIVHAE